MGRWRFGFGDLFDFGGDADGAGVSGFSGFVYGGDA